MPGRYIRILVSWLSLVFKKTCRSYKTFLAVLRLFKRSRKQRTFRECGLALSSQPTELTPSVTLALPLLGAPVQSGRPQPESNAQFPTPQPDDEGSNVATFNTQAPQNIVASSISNSIPMSEPFICPSPPQFASLGQSNIILTRIIPKEIKRYDRKVPMYANHVYRV
jgi:hypothetical protein